MHVSHEGTPIATDVEVARTWRQQLQGLMFRSSIPDDYALVFPFDRAARRSVHMLFVRTPLDVLWTVDDEVTQARTLRPWTGLGWAHADTIIELAPGAASAVDEGDTVVVASD